MSGSGRLVPSLLLAALVSTLAAVPLYAVTVVGHTAGQFQVGETGAATYTVPVAAPPGTAGMEPQLALTYNSQGSNSLLGVGWALSGLSVIGRCQATIAQDGSIAPVDFNSNDRFCLDGERLMAIGGVYGANATEYRTEQDSFRRVISNGQTGVGPSSFTVYTKSGLLFEYGGTTDSRIEAQGSASVLFWAVNRISDTKGNYLTVSYTEANGEYRPNRIDYTGNGETGLLPYASVRFTYETRPDSVPQFVGGAMVRMTQRLTAVRSYEGEQVYREYRLTYDVSEASARSRLLSVTECGSNGDCFAPTVFTWRTWAATDFNFNGTGSGVWPGHAGGQNNNFLGDFNGDGKTDITGYGGSQGLWHVVLSNGTSFAGGGGFWLGHAGGATNNVLGDFNGDGKTDLMGYVGSQGLWHVALSDGATSFNAPGSAFWNGNNATLANTFLGDFNGDGRTDMMSYTGTLGVWAVSLSTGTNFSGPGSGLWAGHRGRASDNFIGDFNGDGRSDSLGYTGVAGQWDVALSDGVGSFRAAGSGLWTGHSGTASNNFLGDFNGDGKTDIMGYTGANGLWHVSLSSGTNFQASGSGNWHGHPAGSGNNVLGDFNGDGMTDIAGYKTNGQWYVCLSTGTDFSCREWTGHTGGTSNNFLGDFNGDGKTDTMRYNSAGNWQVALAGGPISDQMTGITDGHGMATTVGYVTLADLSIYTRGSGAVYPEQDFQGPLSVVWSYAMSDGIGGARTFLYHYGDAKVNLHGRGFRGFGNSSITDTNTGIKTTIIYERDFRCVSTKIRRTEQRQSNGLLINETDNSIEVQDHGFGVSFSFVDESVAKSYELDGSPISTAVTTTDYDDYGNVVSLAVDYGGGMTESTVHTYQDDLSNWLLGRLTRTVVTKTAAGQPTQSRTTTFTYDPTSGLLTSEILEPNHPTLRLVKTYQQDSYGNVVSSTTSGPGIITRTQTSAMNSRGRYILSSTNALGHVETKSYALGNLIRVTGPNQLVTSWEYDAFGRQVRELRPDGTETITTYSRCEGNCPEFAFYFVRSAATGKPVTITYYDSLDRVVRQETQGFDGTPIYSDSKYNARGLRKWMSEPYFAGATPLWTELTFDRLGRTTRETAPGNRITVTEYHGRTTIVTNPLGQQNVRVVDARNQLIESTDALSGTVAYTYDAFGNMVRMTDPMGNVTALTFDIRGNRTSVIDPDTGTTTFGYNALGEMVSETDANHNTMTLAYDVLGRMVSRIEPEGSSTWVYDTRDKGTGKLSRMSRGDYLEEYFYDSLGREEQTRVTIGSSTFSTITGYDLSGRPDILIYPSGFGVRTLYNDQGYPRSLRRTSDNQLLWEAASQNARNQLEQVVLGNGLLSVHQFEPESGRVERIQAGNVQSLSFTFDPVGNLLSRRDDLRGLSEIFGYDSLNRLVSSQASGQGAVLVDYDALGNITSKSDVGNYTYGGGGAGPHAVTSISGSRSAVYSYDRNGNMVNRQRLIASGLPFSDGFESGNTGLWNQNTSSTPVVSTIAYTSFNMPRSITEGTTSLTFSYGPEYARYRQVVTTSSGTTTKLYVGGLFEREVTGASVRDIHYIRAGGEVFAAYIVDSTGAKTRYLHRDHLGSVQTITNETGGVVEVLAFDPWGLRRNAQTWAPSSTITSSLDRGFTGHEHLDEVGLIHMNGRVYDPVIGRFLSADPFVQVPEFSQSLNRYSYVLNNPLSMTDPSGYFFRGLRRFFGRVLGSSIARTALSIVAGYLTGGIGSTIGEFLGGILGGGPLSFAATLGATIGSGAGFGLGSTFTGTLLAGGGFGDALRAGLVSALTGGVSAGTNSVFNSASFGLNIEYAKDVVAHGVTQGLSRVAKGDKFEHGFLSGIFSRVFSPFKNDPYHRDPFLHTISSAVIGGTSAELGGGKFANGAGTSAFIAGFTDIALTMRTEMIRQSYLDDRNVAPAGTSLGFLGDLFKLGGGRYLLNGKPSPLGGFQGGPGSLFGIAYGAGDSLDRLVEAYAGPHDFLNSWYWYDANGNIDTSIYSTPFGGAFGELLNAANVVVATPLVIPSMVPDYAARDFMFSLKVH